MQEQKRRGRKPSPEKRDDILASARVTFGTKGVDAGTTREIAEAAGTTERTLFKHFGSKDGLVQAVVEAVSIELMRERSFARIRDERAFTRAEFAAWHGEFLRERSDAATATPFNYRILFQELLRDDAFRRRYGSRWIELVFAPLAAHLRKMQQAGEIESRLTPEALASGFFSLNLSYLFGRFVLAPEIDWNRDRDVAAIVDMFMSTCGTGR